MDKKCRKRSLIIVSSHYLPNEYCPADSNGERVGCGTLGGLEEMRIRVRRTRSRTLELARMYDEMHN